MKLFTQKNVLILYYADEIFIYRSVFWNYAKAFNYVNHDILIKKLNFNGIRGISLDWFRSYLWNRKQLVRANGTDSSHKTIACGLPQGSVLGPILFLPFINDIINLKIEGKSFLFADDTISITWSNSNIGALHANITADLFKIKAWSDSNLLCFNVDKTVALSYKGALQSLFQNNSQISIVDSVKLLGIFTKEINLPTAKIAYFSLFESHLRYGLPFWGSSTGSQFQAICKLQKERFDICVASVKPQSAEATSKITEF